MRRHRTVPFARSADTQGFRANSPGVSAAGRAGRRLRRGLLATTAVAGLAAMGLMATTGAADAACTPNPVISNNGPIQTSSSASVRVYNSVGATVDVGVIGAGDGTYANNCVLDLVNVQNSQINLPVPATTTFDDAIVLDDASTGNTINVSAALGGTATAILDGAGANTVNIDAGANISAEIQMGAGADVVNFNDGNVTEDVHLGDGDDFFKMSAAGFTNLVLGSTRVYGGDDIDTIRIVSNIPAFTPSSGGPGNPMASLFPGFERLEVEGPGAFSLYNTSGVGEWTSVRVLSGKLILTGTWQITGNTTTVEAGGTLDVGDGVALTDVTEDLETMIAGTLNVTANATFNATGLTTIDGGLLVIQAGGVYNANGGIAGGTGSDAITVAGSLNITVGAALGDGDDTVTLLTGGTVTGIIDGQGNTGAGDSLVLTGSGTSPFDLSGAQFLNFENLVKNGSGTWGLNNGPGSFDTATVNAGTLRLQAGATLNISDTTDVTGGLLYILGTQTTGGTTDVSGGTLRVGNGGLYDANGAVTVTGGSIDVDTGGVFDAALTTTVTSGTLLVDGGFYKARGATLVDGGTLRVDGGDFKAFTTTQVDSGLLWVNGGKYVSVGATTVNGGTLRVDGDKYRARGATLVDGGTIVINDTGIYRAEADVTVTTGLLRVNTGGKLNLVDAGGDVNLFVNGGQLVVLGGLVQTESNVTVQTAGLLWVKDGGIVNNGDPGNTAVETSVLAGGVLRVDNALYKSHGTTTVNGGTLHVKNNGNFDAFGNLTVDGGGVTRLDSGTIDTSLVTTVTNGTLLVTGGVYTATGATNVPNVGILRLDGGTYNAGATTTIDGTGQLRVFGAAIYDATGSNIVVTSGTVLGTGTIRADLLDNQGGTLAPGASVGTLFFTGAYNQASGGNFQAEVDPGSAADLLAVTGSAALLGNIEISPSSTGFSTFEQYRIVSTQNPIPTIFETSSVTGAGLGSSFAWVGRVDDTGTFDPNDPASGNNVDLIIATMPSALPNLTPNQQAVANYLGSQAVAGGVYIEESQILLLTQIVAGGPNAFDQIGGEVYDSFTAFSFDTARQYGRLVDSRVRTLRCAAASGAVSVLCGGGSLLAGTRSGTQVADTGPDAIPTPGADSPRGFSPNTHPYGWSVWASAIGSYLSKDRTSTSLGYSGFTTGGVMGVDLALRKRWIVGIMVGGSKSNIDFSGVGGDGDLSNVGIGVYTAWYGSRWFADASFTYSRNWIEADRTLQFGTVNTTANGKTEGNQYAAHATVGYGFNLRSIALEASGGIDWVQLSQNGFTETGAGALNLTVDSRTDDSLRLRFGVRAARPFTVRQGLMLVPSLEVGYARELLDNTRPITSSLTGIPGSFTVTGDEGSRNILTFGAGVKAEWSQGITLSVNYDGEWAGDRQTHGVTGRLQIRW